MNRERTLHTASLVNMRSRGWPGLASVFLAGLALSQGNGETQWHLVKWKMGQPQLTEACLCVKETQGGTGIRIQHHTSSL